MCRKLEEGRVVPRTLGRLVGLIVFFEMIELTSLCWTGWRNELYAIYASPQSRAFKGSVNKPFGNVAFHLERAACALFGLATFGVHLTGVYYVSAHL